MRLGVHSTMWGSTWGASEHLWSAAADVLLRRGHRVCVRYHRVLPVPPRLRRLARADAELDWHRGPGERLARRLGRFEPLDDHRAWLAARRPDYVLISAGDPADDLSVGLACAERGIPYAILVHAAGGPRFLEGRRLEQARRVWQRADRCLFVSQDNRRVLESELGVAMDRAEIVDNPLEVAPAAPLPWPASGPIRLAAVARLGTEQKGQDLAIRALARMPSDSSPHLHLHGRAHGSAAQLAALARLHGIADRVHVEGFTPHPESIWRRCHALLLPSRYEGMPIVTAEAMWAGRVPIVTACGRNPDLVDDGETGFLIPAATPELVTAGLRRALDRRAEWPRMGRLAAERIRERYPRSAGRRFADRLETLAQGAVA